MKKLILVTSMLIAISACSSNNVQQAEQDLQKPINCATAEGDIRVLMSEKSHTSDQIAAGVSAIVPVGLVVNAASGQEDDKLEIASGKYNEMIDAKIAEIKKECGLE